MMLIQLPYDIGSTVYYVDPWDVFHPVKKMTVSEYCINEKGSFIVLIDTKSLRRVAHHFPCTGLFSDYEEASKYYRKLGE